MIKKSAVNRIEEALDELVMMEADTEFLLKDIADDLEQTVKEYEEAIREAERESSKSKTKKPGEKNGSRK